MDLTVNLCIPEEKTHFMLSCLAMLSMGNMVPRMALRKGTIPYTANTNQEINTISIDTGTPGGWTNDASTIHIILCFMLDVKEVSCYTK